MRRLRFIFATVLLLVVLPCGQAAAQTYDMLNLMLMSPALRNVDHFAGTKLNLSASNHLYTQPTMGGFYWIKGDSGYPWDINIYDANYIYLSTTEYTYASASEGKRFESLNPAIGYKGVPFAKRFMSIGDVVQSSDTRFGIYTACGTATYTNLGLSQTTLTGPFVQTIPGAGSNLPPNLNTIALAYEWSLGAGYTHNSSSVKETFTFDTSGTYGLVQWTTQDWNTGTGSYDPPTDATYYNILTSGVTGLPYSDPCNFGVTGSLGGGANTYPNANTTLTAYTLPSVPPQVGPTTCTAGSLTNCGNLTGAGTQFVDPNLGGTGCRVSDTGTNNPAHPYFTLITDADGSSEDNMISLDDQLAVVSDLGAEQLPIALNCSANPRLYTTTDSATNGFIIPGTDGVGFSRVSPELFYGFGGTDNATIISYNFAGNCATCSNPTPTTVYDFESSANGLGSNFDVTWFAPGSLTQNDSDMEVAFAGGVKWTNSYSYTTGYANGVISGSIVFPTTGNAGLYLYKAQSPPCTGQASGTPTWNQTHYLVTSVAAASGGSTTYTFTSSQAACATNGCTGLLYMSSFLNAANDGFYTASASTTTTITVNNAAGVLENFSPGFMGGTNVDGSCTMGNIGPGGQGDEGAQYLGVYRNPSGVRMLNTATGDVAADWGPTGHISSFPTNYIHNAKIGKIGGSQGFVVWTPLSGVIEQAWAYAASSLTGSSIALCSTYCSGHETAGLLTWWNNPGDAVPHVWQATPVYNLAATSGITYALPAGGSQSGLDSHFGQNFLNDAYPFCGTTTLNGTPTTAWTNEVMCWQSSYVFGVNPFRFLQTENSGQSWAFQTQQAISVVSSSGKIILFGSDWQGTMGSSSGTSACVLTSTCRGDVFLLNTKETVTPAGSANPLVAPATGLFATTTRNIDNLQFPIPGGSQ